jgi:hypothetical protein
MKIENIEVKPYENSILPSISFEVKISHIKYREAISDISGWLETDDGKIIGELRQIIEKVGISELGAHGTSFDPNFKEEIYNAVLITILDRRALDHIEKRRMSSRKGDVKLILNLNIKNVENRAEICHLHEVDPRTIGLQPLKIVKYSGGITEGQIIAYAYDPEFSSSRTNRWILSGNNNPIFLSVKEQILKGEKTISSSDWIHDYAPKLELGEYFIVEIPKGKEIIDAWKYVEKAEECLRKWDTKGAYANCREVGKLLNRIIKEKFKDDPTIKKWKRAIEKFEYLTSLDLHVEDIREEEPKGEIIIGRADVEHVLIVTKALVKYTEELLLKT